MVKFYCKQSDFLYALNTVSKAIDSNNTLPVLNNVLISVEGKEITLLLIGIIRY